jgi:hypothetical protein
MVKMLNFEPLMAWTPYENFPHYGQNVELLTLNGLDSIYITLVINMYKVES